MNEKDNRQRCKNRQEYEHIMYPTDSNKKKLLVPTTDKTSDVISLIKYFHWVTVHLFYSIDKDLPSVVNHLESDSRKYNILFACSLKCSFSLILFVHSCSCGRRTHFWMFLYLFPYVQLIIFHYLNNQFIISRYKHG